MMTGNISGIILADRAAGLMDAIRATLSASIVNNHALLPASQVAFAPPPDAD
jgi:hypothetical protein